MRFGILLDHQYPKSEDIGQRIDECIEITELARDHGFSYLFGLHHYLASLATPQPFLLLSRLLPHVGDMTIGTAIYVVTLTHPVQLAEETATLDQLAKGRFILGAGAGYRDDEFESFDVPRATRGARFVETLDLLRQLWSGDEVDFDGEFFQVHGQTLSVLPVQQPGPPIWIGANTTKTIRRAARVGDAWITSPNVKYRWAKGNLGEFKEELEAQGEELEGRRYPILRDMYVGETDAAAEEEGIPWLHKEYLAYAPYELEFFKTMFNDLKKKAFLFGDPATVRDKIQDYADAGFTDMLFRISWQGMPRHLWEASLHRFATEVMPHFTEEASA